MKQLQNNFTTPEQSKRLLEIGVPADSADFRYCIERSYETMEYIYDDFPTYKYWDDENEGGYSMLVRWSTDGDNDNM